MTRVRIFQPSKTAMQSGKGKTKRWLMEFETNDPLNPDPLMGWVSSNDPSEQLRLFFSTLEEALQFAARKGIPYSISTPTEVLMAPKDYASNFTCPRMRGG